MANPPKPTLSHSSKPTTKTQGLTPAPLGTKWKMAQDRKKHSYDLDLDYLKKKLRHLHQSRGVISKLKRKNPAGDLSPKHFQNHDSFKLHSSLWLFKYVSIHLCALCLPLCNSMDLSLPGSLSGNNAKWVAFPPPGDLDGVGLLSPAFPLLHWLMDSLPLGLLSLNQFRFNEGKSLAPEVHCTWKSQ